MITFLIGLGILLLGSIFYGRYVESQFQPDDRLTPSVTMKDGVDYVPLDDWRNRLIQLLNIAGLGPILGAIQGVLFGPIAFILIPVGCIFAGAVHDYFSGMISMRHQGLQVTALIEKYLGRYVSFVFNIIIMGMLLLVGVVFVYTAGDVFMMRFFDAKDLLLTNPIVLITYGVIALYYLLATLFSVDKIIGRLYPWLGGLLLLGTVLMIVGFLMKGLHLQELNIGMLNMHPKGLPLIPMFFMTVSCGLLSGFHSTQSTILSRTIQKEKQGRGVFFEMMCVESFIAMIWAAGAMHVYQTQNMVFNGVGAINHITTTFVPEFFVFLVTLSVIILPITTGDTALRGLRISLSDMLNLNQKTMKNRLLLAIPIFLAVFMMLFLIKVKGDQFAVVWRYFAFTNLLIALPTFFYAMIYLKKNQKNFWIVLIPGLFFTFVAIFYLLTSIPT